MRINTAGYKKREQRHAGATPLHWIHYAALGNVDRPHRVSARPSSASGPALPLECNQSAPALFVTARHRLPAHLYSPSPATDRWGRLRRGLHGLGSRWRAIGTGRPSPKSRPDLPGPAGQAPSGALCCEGVHCRYATGQPTRGTSKWKVSSWIIVMRFKYLHQQYFWKYYSLLKSMHNFMVQLSKLRSSLSFIGETPLSSHKIPSSPFAISAKLMMWHMYNLMIWNSP